jgi:hypothetical protein
VGTVLSVASIAAYAYSDRQLWAWMAIVLFGVLAVSFAWTARDEYHLRVKAEGLNARPLFLERAIADGRALIRMTDVMNMGIEWERWRPETSEMLREQFGLREAQNFFDAAGVGEHPDRFRVPAYVKAQIEFLEALAKR